MVMMEALVKVRMDFNGNRLGEPRKAKGSRHWSANL